MVWKKVVNSDPGDADHFGGDDTDKISDAFSGVDVDDFDINLDCKIRSAKLQLRNPANTFSYIVTAAAIGADRILNLPLLTATDTLATLGLAQTFTEPQKIAKNVQPLLTLYKATSSTGVSNNNRIEFTLNDSGANETVYGRIAAEIFDATDGSEDGVLRFSVPIAGTMQDLMTLTETGTLRCGGINRRIQLDESGLTGTRTFTFPNVDGQVHNDGDADQSFRDNRLRIWNPADTFRYTITGAAIAADRQLNLPLTTATDTLASLGLAQTFTETQTISKDTAQPFKVYRPANTVNNKTEINIDANDSTSTQTTYARLSAEIIDNTDGSEDGAFRIYHVKAGSMSTGMLIDELGKFKCGGPNTRISFVETGLTNTRDFTFPDISTGGAGTSPRVKNQTHQYFEMEDEFMIGSISNTNTSNQIGVLNWGTSATGTSAPTVGGGVLNHPGIANMITGAATNDNMRMHLGDSATKNAINIADLERIAWIIRVPTITSIIIRIGLAQDLSAADMGTSGIFFKFDPVVNAAWQTITRQSSTSTTNTTGTTVTANNWYLLEIVHNSADNWEFYINESLAFTHSTNEPSGGHVIGQVVQTTTTAARQLDVDWFKIRTNIYGQRWT